MERGPKRSRMSIPYRELGKIRIQNRNLSVECVHTRPEASGGSTTLLQLYRPIHQGPTAYHAEPSLWSLSLAKRCVDLFFAAVALLLFWPLLLVTALLVRYESPGPVIFRQKRVGRHGVLFTVFKFRTMEIAGPVEGPCVSKRGDRRGTRIGENLRKDKT